MTETLEAVSLERWVTDHGPLARAVALTVALKTAVAASQMDASELAANIGSLNARCVRRHPESGWTWYPVPDPQAATSIGDVDIIERIGAILFRALTSHPLEDAFASEQTIREQLRRHLPSLPAAVADITAGAIGVRRRHGMTLAAFAGDLRRAIGVQPTAQRSRLWQVPFASTVAGAIGLALMLWAWTASRGADRIEPHGLSGEETALLDVLSEAASTLAVIGEHTVAIQHYEQIARLWRTRLPRDDARIAWSLAHEAWVRGLDGDLLTAEQLFVDAPSWLSAQLGDSHPYTRTSQLLLSAVIDAHKAGGDPSALQQRARTATTRLLGDSIRASDLAPGIPAPPGTLAHVAPNPAEREGFRVGPDGSFYTLLSSVQRLVAGRDGWRLHAVVTDSCRATLDIGAVPRRIAMNAARRRDGRWEVGVSGLVPPPTIVAAAGDRVSFSVIASADGVVDLHVGEDSRSARVDMTAPLAAPPHALQFHQDRADGCRVVWLEIPFPWQPASTRPAQP